MRDANKTEVLLYSIQVHQHFRARYGKGTTLTMEEWSCIQQWRERGIQLECVFRGIDLAFSVNVGKVSSVLDCANAVREVCDLQRTQHTWHHQV
jgi:hypothetical protein